jgi:hypothetical protein
MELLIIRPVLHLACRYRDLDPIKNPIKPFHYDNYDHSTSIEFKSWSATDTGLGFPARMLPNPTGHKSKENTRGKSHLKGIFPDVFHLAGVARTVCRAILRSTYLRTTKRRLGRPES